MASYVLSGYSTPTGVNSASAVKQIQQQLGVKVDGVWGPQTQAAYDALVNAPYTSPSSSSSSSSSSYSSSSSTPYYGNSSSTMTYQVYNGGTPSGKTTTSFTPTATTQTNTANQKQVSSAGDYSTVLNRQLGYIEHASGYTGYGYRDEKGKFFTEYGALLREDGCFYPEGSTISQNGMYYDTGSGWQYAGTAKTANGDYVYSSVAGSGTAPGSLVFKVDKDSIGSTASYSSSNTANAYNTNTQTSTQTNTQSNAIESDLSKLDPPSSAWESYFDDEIENYRKKLFEGYGY